MTPLFLPGSRGPLFAILYEPSVQDHRGALLFVHPFGEEMNKSRRMVALQARAFARNGWWVLQIDLFGCGDSAGDFPQANWQDWVQDIELSLGWLSERAGCGVSLWGLRFGALLAAEVAHRGQSGCERLVLWQPLLRGAMMLSTLLRQKMVSQLEGQEKTTSAQLKARLERGEPLELSGYVMTPGMAAAMDQAQLPTELNFSGPVDWLDVLADPTRQQSGAGLKLRDAWQAAGIDLRYQAVAGDAFWNAGEIVEAPELIVKTLKALR